MDIANVEKLAQIMEQYGLTHLKVEETDMHVELKKEQVMVSAALPVASAPQAAASSAPAAAAAAQTEQAQGEAIASPLVGVVYLASSPEAAPFVKVGDKVAKGQILCIVEAMKVMNEFVAPRDGEVCEISVQNGELVECGQCLFRLV